MLILLVSLSVAMAQNFQGHTEFAYDTYRGQVTVQCPMGSFPSSGSANCREDVLEPFEMGYFTTEGPVDADKVHLTSFRADGKRIEKSEDFDGAQGRSKKRLNLWIETLFQTGLLDVGDNRIAYRLTKRGRDVQSGEFNVRVTKGRDVRCQRLTLFNQDPLDCQNPSRACPQYFAQTRCE